MVKQSVMATAEPMRRPPSARREAPPPAVVTERAETLQQAEDVRQQLTQLRMMLEGRQQQVSQQLAKEQEQYQKLQMKKLDSKPNAGGAPADVFDRVRRLESRQRKNVAGVPGESGTVVQVAPDALKQFNELKYRDVKGPMANFVNSFPEPPTSGDALDAQVLYTTDTHASAAKSSSSPHLSNALCSSSKINRSRRCGLARLLPIVAALAQEVPSRWSRCQASTSTPWQRATKHAYSGSAMAGGRADRAAAAAWHWERQAKEVTWEQTIPTGFCSSS